MWDRIRGAVGQFTRAGGLQVYFDPAATYLTRDVVDAGGVPGYFCHLMVRSAGPATARNCRGRVLEVGVRRPDGSTAPAPELPGPTFLKWAREPDFGPRDVEVDRPRPLDLCFALASTPAQLRFFAPPSPSGVLIFPPGVYRVKVEVTADDMRPAYGVFAIDFTQGWDRIVVGEAA